MSRSMGVVDYDCLSQRLIAHKVGREAASNLGEHGCGDLTKSSPDKALGAGKYGSAFDNRCYLQTGPRKIGTAVFDQDLCGVAMTDDRGDRNDDYINAALVEG